VLLAYPASKVYFDLQKMPEEKHIVKEESMNCTGIL